MSRSLPGGRTQQGTGAAAAQAAAQQYSAAAPGTAVTLPAYITPERAAILAGTAPAPTPAPGPTIIKPAPGQASQPPAPTPPAVFDDPDDTADHAPTNPYLSLLGDGPETLTDNAAATTAPDDAAGGSFDWLFKMGWGYGTILIVPAVLLLGLLLWRRRS